MRRLQRALSLAKAVGWENLPRRIVHMLAVKSGWSRLRLPAGDLPREKMLRQFVAGYSTDHVREHWRQRAEKFFVPQPASSLRDTLLQIASDEQWQRTTACASTDLEQGVAELFSRHKVFVGSPIDFNRDPMNNVQWPVGRHWSQYKTFDPSLNDIKCVWELSRFSIAYQLARNYVRNQNKRPAEQFVDLLQHWRRGNPYGLTPQWICGQEATFRLMALLFASCVMLPDMTDDALQTLSELAWYTGRHIERNITFARSQKNNHAISEAVGMWTIGVLFPELRRSTRWRTTGRAILQAELARQVYPDGSYVQNSMNYHRVMLDDVLWATALSRSANEPFDHQLHVHFGRAVDWMLQVVDPDSGQVPNYGSNDGANVLPLSTTDYRDFRPTVQAAYYALHGQRCFDRGPWDEKLLWLFGPAAMDAPVAKVDRPCRWSAPQGGYYVMRGQHSRLFTRIHSYIDRPSEADMLHVDLWSGAANILRDGGSYKYFDPGGTNKLKSTAAHNTIEIDGLDQMEKGPRFLWLHWTKSKLRRFEASDDGRIVYLDGEHYGYHRLADPVTHRRSILQVDDAWLIVDELHGNAQHDVALRWRLFPTQWHQTSSGWSAQIDDRATEIDVVVPAGFNVVLSDGKDNPEPSGWESNYYCQKSPTPTLVVRGNTTLPVRLVTVARLGGAKLAIDTDNSVLTDLSSPILLCDLPSERQERIADISAGRIVAAASASVA